MSGSRGLSIGQCAAIACLLEVSAPKPGNVHRGADFEDLTFHDFALSAAAIAPIFDAADRLRVGQIIYQGVVATRSLVGTNTNLGLLLLMAPLAKVPAGVGLREGVASVLASLTPQDAADVYAAIAHAHPGGLGEVEEHDVAGAPPENLLDAMRLAADRDLIARQYVASFEDLDELVVQKLRAGLTRGWRLTDAIVHTHVGLMAARPDSLIGRKCGPEVQQKSALLAQQVLDQGGPGDEDYEKALADLDFWLRSDGHRRNPGTSADLIGAGLFWLLLRGELSPPWR